MTKTEIEIIKDYCSKKQLMTKNEIENFIIETFPNRKDSLMRFYMFDLFNNNVIYRLNSKYYKFCNDLINFDYQNTKTDEMITKKIEERFPEMETCVWSTLFLSNFMNLQPYVSYTFIEVDSLYVEILFDYLKNIYENLLINPNEKELYYYTKGSNPIIIRPLVKRAPLEKPYSNSIGGNRNIKTVISKVFRVTIEKIIVDIFIDKDKINLYSEWDSIITCILKTYSINFQKLFSYAKYRNVEEEIQYFLNDCINFNTEKGEFAN
jgi:hypothetical protein